MTEKKIIELQETGDPTRTTRVEFTRSRPVREGSTPLPSSSADQRPNGDPSKSSYSSYLFGSSGTDERPAWSDSAHGRGVIRLFSRGVVGAAFFVAGGHIAKKQLTGYESWKEIGPLSHKNFLAHIAKGWDHTVGRGLENVTHFLTPGDAAAKAAAAWEVTSFRTKTFNGLPGSPITHVDRWGFEHHLNGRSLGAEIVTVTFDFFMASIGDAMTRNIVQSFDPNVKQPWLLDKDGHATTRDKGRFDGGKFVQSLGRSSWRILSKNAGEDWAAALPYVYQMKWQRQALAKVFPGFKLSSDNGWNGGMARIAVQDNPAMGVHKGQVTGGYQLPGLLDLQVRFTGYNWYTLMYREMYDSIGRSIDKIRHGQPLHMPEAAGTTTNPLMLPIDGAGFLARYITKSFIKANLYMNLAVIPFWLFRTPQSKWRGGIAVDELATAKTDSRENALLTTKPYGLAPLDRNGNPTFVENIEGHLFPRADLIHGGKRPDVAYYGNGKMLRASDMAPGTKHIFNMKNPYESGASRSIVGHLLNPFGWMCYKSGSLLTRAVDAVARDVDPITKLMHGPGATLLDREKTLRNFVDASYSYTPYMWAKAETALRVDDRRSIEELGHMDKAIYRLIDNTFSFNGHGMKAAAGDIWKLARNLEKDVKSREGVGAGHQPVGDGTVVPRTPDVAGPVSRIDTATVAHEGIQRYDAGTPDRAGGEHRKWAENVTGRKLDAQFLPGRTTLH